MVLVVALGWKSAQLWCCLRRPRGGRRPGREQPAEVADASRGSRGLWRPSAVRARRRRPGAARQDGSRHGQCRSFGRRGDVRCGGRHGDHRSLSTRSYSAAIPERGCLRMTSAGMLRDATKTATDTSPIRCSGEIDRRDQCFCGGWFAAGWFVNPNRFSLHALYRNRLIRGFLGGPHLGAPIPPPPPAQPIHRLRRRPTTVAWRNCGRGPSRGTGLAAVSCHQHRVQRRRGRNLAWQQRKAEPFIVTPLACGSHGPGYRPTSEYGDEPRRYFPRHRDGNLRGRGKPSNGIPLVAADHLLLAVLNVRLGWWLGNPGPSGPSDLPKGRARIGFGPFFSELFGLTTDNRPYVYLSDGGHFENLGYTR